MLLLQLRPTPMANVPFGTFCIQLRHDQIGSCLQVGLLISAPLFAEASKHFPALRLMAVGLGAWILSTAGCAFSFGQPSCLPPSHLQCSKLAPKNAVFCTVHQSCQNTSTS